MREKRVKRRPVVTHSWSLKGFIREHPFQLLLGMPVVFTAVGVLILDFYLAQYGIIDFQLVKPQILLAGTTFAFVLAFSIYFFSLFHNLSDLTKNRTGILLALLPAKIMILSLMAYSALSYSGDWAVRLLWLDFNPTRLQGLSRLAFTYLILTLQSFALLKDELPKGLRIAVWGIQALLFLFLLPAFCILVAKDTVFQKLLTFVAVVGFTHHFAVLGTKWQLEERARAAKELKQKPIWFGAKWSLKAAWHQWIFRWLLLVPTVIGLIWLYSWSLYSRLPMSLGGGMGPGVTLSTQEESITGRMIYQKGNLIYFMENERLRVLHEDAITSMTVVK